MWSWSMQQEQQQRPLEGDQGLWTPTENWTNLSALLALRASAIAVAPESPKTLLVSEMRVKLELFFRAEASDVAPFGPISLLFKRIDDSRCCCVRWSDSARADTPSFPRRMLQ